VSDLRASGRKPLGRWDGMVRFKHRYLVASVAATPEVSAELGPKEITTMLKVLDT